MKVDSLGVCKDQYGNPAFKMSYYQAQSIRGLLLGLRKLGYIGDGDWFNDLLWEIPKEWWSDESPKEIRLAKSNKKQRTS